LANVTETIEKIAGAELAIVRGGSGKPLLMFHDELGYPGWMGWNEALSSERQFRTGSVISVILAAIMPASSGN
jgi:hypothetical protein